MASHPSQPSNQLQESLSSHHARPCPSTTRKEIYDVDPHLFESLSRWLRSHGKGIRPHLTEQQKNELETVFHLMDEDGSGSIDTQELHHAFRLLGFRLSKKEIQELVDEVDHDKTGELEWTEFIEIFLETLRRLSEEKREEEELGEPGKTNQVPLALMATAYRRKKILGGIFECTTKSLADIIKAGEDEKTRAKAREDKLQDIKSRRASEFSKGVPQQTLNAVAIASSLSPHDLLDLLSHDEIKAVSTVVAESARSPHQTRKNTVDALPPLLTRSARSSSHLATASPTSNQPHSSPHSLSPLVRGTSSLLPPLSPTNLVKAKAPRAVPSPFGEEWDRLAALSTAPATDSMVIPIKSTKHVLTKSKTGIL